MSSRLLPGALGLTVLLSACAEADVVVPEESLLIFRSVPREPAARIPANPASIALGRRLYHDARLSRDGKVSCAVCHSLDTFGVDRKVTSAGTGGQLGGRNSPTSFNAFRQTAQFWDGRAATVEEQALGPILNPVEHGLKDATEVVGFLRQDPATVELFQKAFPGDPDPLTFANVGNAIGAFERTLVTRSRFDTFLAGDKAALSNAEKRGLLEFVGTGCTTCHFSSVLGGQMLNKLGLLHPYETRDFGRFEHTKNDADRYFFKVPMLINVAETGPYLHDGSISELGKVVEIMAWHQLGKKLDPSQVQSIVAFLGSLTGELEQVDK